MTDYLHVQIPRHLKNALRTFADAQNSTLTAVTQAAIENYLNPDEYKTASLRLLTDLSRKLDVVLKRNEVSVETLGRFILIYLLHTPPLPDHERTIALREARARYDSFIEKLAHSLAQNRTFLTAIEERSPDPTSFFYSQLKDLEGGDDT